MNANQVERGMPKTMPVIVINALGMIWFRKVSINKGILPVVRCKNPSNDAFGEHNKIGTMFICSMCVIVTDWESISIS